MPQRRSLQVHGGHFGGRIDQNLIFRPFGRLNGLQSIHLGCWPISDVGIGSHWPCLWGLETWYAPQGVSSGSWGHFGGRFDQKSHFRPFGPPEWSSTHSFGLLTNFQYWDRFSLTLPMSFGYLIWHTGGHISYLVVLDKPQSLRFDRWTSANVERGSHWPYQFLMLYITYRGSLGVMGAFSGGRFDQNLIFWSFCCTRWSSIPKFGLLSNF